MKGRVKKSHILRFYPSLKGNISKAENDKLSPDMKFLMQVLATNRTALGCSEQQIAVKHNYKYEFEYTKENAALCHNVKAQ